MERTGNPPVIRLDAKTALSDFYDNLFVQCLLQHAATPRAKSDCQILRGKVPGIRNEWHTFLDNLCFLCDWRPAGKTVVSIGAEELNDSVILRLSARPPHLQQAGPHLEQVIASLRSGLELPDGGKLATSKTIASIAITRSKKKIFNYYDRLRRVLAKPSTSRHDDLELLQIISQDMPSRDQLRDLCSWAYEFRLSATCRLLQRRMFQPWSEQFSMIHHFIGRLGYWHKASFSLVRHSSNFADILRRAQVLPLEIHGNGYDPKPRLDEDLEGLASRVFPNFRGTPICSALIRLMEEPRDLLSWFKNRSLKCRPHAEAVVTDWFFAHHARFVNDDRYVGCSKRSCFCCALYMKLHPAKMQQRPTHGNVWVQWLFPRPLSLDGKVDDHEAENLGLLIRMTSEIRRISQGSLTNAAGLPRQRFESTTGISTSL